MSQAQFFSSKFSNIMWKKPLFELAQANGTTLKTFQNKNTKTLDVEGDFPCSRTVRTVMSATL